MFFSSKQFADYLNGGNNGGNYVRARVLQQMGKTGNRDGSISDEDADTYLTGIKAAITKRQRTYNNTENLSKWLRPWEVVPELATFAPPAGDFGVGVEVELGFNTMRDAQFVAEHIADWEYVTLDWEGPSYPIEATFAPHLLSDFHNSLPVKYLNFLATIPDRIYPHEQDSLTGTHVNVSYNDGSNRAGWHYSQESLNTINAHIGYMRHDDQVKYFGRRPYSVGHGQYSWIEWKLFNSQTDAARLQQYVNVAVELTRMAYTMQSHQITQEVFNAALETGYNMPIVQADTTVSLAA